MESKTIIRTAILITCYNRIEKTLKCLDNLFKASIPDKATFDVYLVDADSPDQTGKIIKEKYPQINVIPGGRSLYWNRGMRLAWEHAHKNHDYDFYLWLNDDTFIKEKALNIIFDNYYNLLNDGIEAIVSGVCHGKDANEITYGGLNKINGQLLTPNGTVQQCRYINGNFTLVSKKIFSSVGFLSYKYNHGGGDFDYGLRAIKSGFKCYISSSILAECIIDPMEVLDWFNPEKSLYKRSRKLFTAKRGHFRDSVLLSLEDSGFFGTLKYIFVWALNFIFASKPVDKEIK